MALIEDLVRRAYMSWDDARLLFETGRELHDRNRLPLAREVLARAIELDPDNTDAWGYLGFAHLRNFNPDKGVEILREGVEKTGSQVLRGTLASFTPDEEEQKALRAKMEGSEDPVVRADLASARLWAGDESAFAELKKLRAEHPDNPKIRETWLWIMFAAGGRPGGEEVDVVKEAIPAADEKIADEKGRISGHWMKAQLLGLAKEWNAVLEATGEALAEFPDEETMMHLRGRAYRELGDIDRAAQCQSRAIGMKPSFVGARIELGKCYEAMEKFDLAEEIFREIEGAHPEYAAGPVSLALFLGRRGRWEEAERIAIEAWPKMEDWQRGRLMHQPDAKELFERDAVKAAIQA